MTASAPPGPHATQAAAGSGGGAARMTTAPVVEAPRPSGSSPATCRRLDAAVAGIFRDRIAASFVWPFHAAALAGPIAVVPALFTGRRLGEHEGRHEMTRQERLEASGRDAAGNDDAGRSDGGR